MPELTSNWQKLKRLSGLQWIVVLQSPLVLLLTWLRLKRGGYWRTHDHIHLLTGPETPPDHQLELAKKISYALSKAIKFGPWRPRCLVRSLALGWYLSRRGISFDIRIGVPQGGVLKQHGDPVDFIAHAWVEHAGTVLNDRQDIADTYSAFDTGSESV